MTSLLRISEASSLALHTVTVLAGSPNRVRSARGVARALGASETHLAKVLQRLAKAGIVRSTRGPKGGFKLAKPADEITFLDVYEAIEGRLVTTDCLLDKPVCGGACMMGGLLHDVNALVAARLRGTKVSDVGLSVNGWSDNA